jgi:hypothetical protein
MRLTAILLTLLLWPALAIAQEWQEFTFKQDGFSINFPAPPQITEIKWTSQLRYTLPARVYSATKGQERYTATVVDFSGLEQQGVARWKQCPPGNAQCRDGGQTIGPGYWKQDERGAMAFAVAKYMKDPQYTISDYAWEWQDMVEGYSLRLLSKDKRRVLVYVAQHNRKLYILEASAPESTFEPGLFQQSMGYLDETGNRIRYTETIYSGSYHGLGVYPRPMYRVNRPE